MNQKRNEKLFLSMHGHDADIPLDMQARDTSVQKLWSRSLRKLLYALEIVRRADWQSSRFNAVTQ